MSDYFNLYVCCLCQLIRYGREFLQLALDKSQILISITTALDNNFSLDLSESFSETRNVFSGRWRQSRLIRQSVERVSEFIDPLSVIRLCQERLLCSDQVILQFDSRWESRECSSDLERIPKGVRLTDGTSFVVQKWSSTKKFGHWLGLLINAPDLKIPSIMMKFCSCIKCVLQSRSLN